jgi:hypothetical protein
MAVISRPNNTKFSETRHNGNWRTEVAKYAKYVGGLGALSGLGYLGYQGYKKFKEAQKEYQDLSNTVDNIIRPIQKVEGIVRDIPQVYQDIYTGIIENPRGFSIPGGFPK